jgi:hypothetical protein
VRISYVEHLERISQAAGLGSVVRLFSLLRSGEILIGAAMTPPVGPVVDRYGGRWLMVGGAMVAGIGFMLMSQVARS